MTLTSFYRHLATWHHATHTATATHEIYGRYMALFRDVKITYVCGSSQFVYKFIIYTFGKFQFGLHYSLFMGFQISATDNETPTDTQTPLESGPQGNRKSIVVMNILNPFGYLNEKCCCLIHSHFPYIFHFLSPQFFFSRFALLSGLEST